MAVIKIAQRGSDCGNLVRYLFGKGKHNEHTNQRTIAGTTHAHSGPWDKASIHQVVTDLRAFAQANPQSRIGQEHKHIWHAAISLPPGESLDDAGWAKLSQEYMRGMGFEDPSKSPIRWTAIHHGLSREGNDHVHLVMSMIRQDGTKVRVHEDAKRSRPVLTDIETRLGLTVLKPLPNGARPITYKAGERGKAEDLGHPIEREDLANRVRAAATASKTEAEFVRRLRGAGLVVKPREGTGLQEGRITGYAVGFPRADGKTILFGGGKLARDLSLPRLRQIWREGPAGVEQAAGEWRLGRNGAPRVKYGRETRKNVPVPGDVKRELDAAHLRLATATEEEFPALSTDLAGALSLASAHDPRLTALSREVGRSAQTTGAGRRRKGSTFLNLAMLVMALNDPDPRTRELLMIRQVVATLVTLVQTHRSRAAAITKGRSTGMSQPDAVDETVEMGVTTGVTVGAMAVQAALHKMHSRKGKDKDPAVPDSVPDAVPATGGEVITPLAKPGPTDLREHVGNQMDALRIPAATLGDLGDAELFSLSSRLDETIAQDPVAQDRLALLEREPRVPTTSAEQGRRDWIMTASGDDLRAEVQTLQNTPTQAPAAQNRSSIPNWRTGGDPMTPAQRFTLKNLCAQHGIDPNKDLTITLDDGTQVPFRDFTKAQASGAISEFHRLDTQGQATPAGVGVGNSSVRSATAQQVILSTPVQTTAPDVHKNVGGRNSRF